MADLKVKKKGYPVKLISSLHNLWSATEMLSLRKIRPGFLQYFFAFPLSMILINIQDFILADGSVFGFAYTTITFLAFVSGAIILFALSSEKNITAVSKISALITAAGLIPWLFLPEGHPAFICSVIFMAGIGGCVSSSSFSFVFVLNNAERFFGCAFMILFIDLIELGFGFSAIHPIARKTLSVVMISILCVCVYLSRKSDYAGVGEKTVKKFDPSIWMVLFIFFSYFAIRITGFYAPAFQHPTDAQLWGLLAMIPILLCIILQVVFKRSVWTMCNVFFLSSILSHVMWYLELPEIAYLFSELKEVGFLITFYLIGCVTYKFCDFRMHKRLILLCMAVIGVLYLGIDLLHTAIPAQPFAALTASVLFVVFLLLSPDFSQHLFFADWSKEFRMIHMSRLTENTSRANVKRQMQSLSLDDTNLSPREKQVVLLLLQGMTLRQVAPELGLTVSTVSTYSKAIYKKLGINSRAELFLLFGRPYAAEEIESIVKE